MADEDIGSLAVKLALDDSSFQQGLQNLKRNMSVIDSSFKSSIAGVKDWGKNLDSMKKNATALGEKIQLQKQIVQTYSEQLEKSKKSLQDNAKTMLDLKSKVDEAKTAWQEAAATEGKNAEKTQELKKAYEDLNKQYTDAETKVRNNQKSIDGYSIQVNNATAKLKGMESQLASVNRQIALQSSSWVNAGSYISQAGEKVKTLGEGFTKVGENLSTHVTLPIVAGLTAATLSAASFEHQMADIQKEIAAKGEDVNSIMGQMSKSSLQWSEDFGQSTEKINEGLLTLVKDGYSGSEAMSIMQTSLYTARGANEDLATVVDQLGSSLEAYGMKTNNAAQTTANMSKMADTFAYISNHTKASITSLGEAFSTVGATANSLKQPMSETASAIGILESNGIDASTAATSLQAGLVNLTKPTEKMKKALDELKFSAFDSKGNMKDLATILTEMNSKMVGWTNQQKEAAIATIFGKESLASWNVLMNKGGDYLKNLSDNANNATGEVQKLSDSMKNTPENNLKELQESMKALGVAIGKDVVPTLIPLVKEATGAVKSFANLDDGTKKMIITIAGVTAVVGPALIVTGKVITAIGAIEKGVGSLLTGIGKRIAANAVDTASTATNTAATNINTAAQEANTKARETNAASEGISTAAKDVSTAAEAENTAVTAANTAAQGKNATGLLGSAKNFIGLGTAAGTAGEAVAGAGAAAGEAGGAISGAGAAAGGTAAAGLGIFAVAAAGVAVAGYGIYKAYKYVTDETVPQIDLFANSVVSTATKVKAQNGTVATQMKDTTVSISNSTKQAISSYMDMDKKVSKSMQDIYVNSNNFSKQEKSSVISAYTDMTNKVTSLTGSNKNAVLNNFKQMVSNTTTLTKQSRADIVKEYSTMVNQVSGLTAQQKQKTIKDFSDSLVQASGITQSQATGIINQFKQMGDKINSAIDQTDKKQLKGVQDLFSKTTTISNAEQSDILNSMQHSDASKKAEAQIYEKQITDIYTNAVNNHKQITQQEQEEINDIRQRMQNLAVQTMSKSEVEQKVIMQRLKDYNGQMTLAQASDTIQNAEKAHKGAVDAANKQYSDTLATIIQMRDGSHKITSQQADDMIKEAKRQRDQSVKEADGQKQEIVTKVKQMDSNVESELNTSTGKQLSTFQKFSRDVSSVFSSIGSWWDSLWSKIGGTHNIDINTVTSGATGSVSSAASALSNLHGLRLNAAGGIFNQATRVTLGGNPNNIVGEGQYSEAVIPLSNNVLSTIGEGIVKATTELKNNKLSVEFADNSGQATQFGQKTMESIASGIKSKTNLLASVTTDMGNTIGIGLDKAYTDVSTVFKNQLGTTVDVIHNKAIAVSNALANMVMPERNDRKTVLDQIAKGSTTADLALQNLQHTNDMLGVSTGDTEKDFRNMLGQMTNLSTMALVADNAYLKLGNTVGWSDSKTQDMLKDYQDYQKQYNELGEKLVQQEADNEKNMKDTAVSSLNSLFDKLKSALKDYYDDAEKQDEASWQTKIDNNSKWKEDTLNNLESVYNAQKEAIENQKTLLDRNDSDQDDADKIAEDKKILSMNYSAKKKKEAQDDLNSILKEQNRRHQKESLDDQETALEKQYNINKDNVEKAAQQNEDYYNSQITSIKNFYADKEKEDNLDAKAQKLIVSNNQTEIVKLLTSYGQDYEMAGASLGERLVAGFKNQMYSIQEIADATTQNINSIVSQINTASLSVPSAAMASSNSYSTSYNTNYNSSYGSLFHTDKLVLNNNQDTKNLMEEIQRIADIQRMSKGVK